MASIFGHVIASTALGSSFFPRLGGTVLVLGGACAFLPDADVLSFHFGIPYSSQWGHRGFTHSIVFALGIGALSWLLARGPNRQAIALYLGLCTLSHPLLDMLTDGGRGVALYWPFSLERIFFPVQPIKVSPLGVANFFSPWGLQVLFSELYWIGVPSIVVYLCARYWRRSIIQQ